MRTRLRSSRVIDSSSTPINNTPPEAPAETSAYQEPTVEAEQPSSYADPVPVVQVESYEVAPPVDEFSELIGEVEQAYAAREGEQSDGGVAAVAQPDVEPDFVDSTFVAPPAEDELILEAAPVADVEPVVEATAEPVAEAEAEAEQPVEASAEPAQVDEPPAEVEPPARGRRGRRSAEPTPVEDQGWSAPARLPSAVQRFGPWVEQQVPSYEQMQQTVQTRIAQLIGLANGFSQEVQAEVDRELARYAEERQSYGEELEAMRQAMNDLRSVMNAEQEAHLESLLQLRQEQETRLAQEREQAETEVTNHLHQAREARERLLRDAYAERDRVLAETRRLSGRLGELQRMMQGLFGGTEAPAPIEVPEPVEQYHPVVVPEPEPAPAPQQPEEVEAPVEEPQAEQSEQLVEAPVEEPQAEQSEQLVETPVEEPQAEQSEQLVETPAAETEWQDQPADEPQSEQVAESYAVVEQPAEEAEPVAEAPAPEPEPEPAPAPRIWRTERRLVMNGVRTLTLASDLLDRLEQNQGINEASLVEFEHGALVVHVRHAANLGLEQLMEQEFRDVLDISGSDDNTIILSTRS